MNIKTSNADFWITCGLGALAASFTLFCLATTYPPLDLWGYLAFGRLYWTGRSFPYQDVFAYVPTLKPWVYHEWLTGVVFYPLSIAAGAVGLQTLKYCLGLGTVALAYATARRRGASQVAATLFVLLTALILGRGYSAVRAQIFTFFFFVLVLYILERVRLSQRWGGLMWLPLILVPWANFHGGFVAGLGLIVLYALGEALSGRPFWPYVLTLVFATLATLINPYGLEYWSYLAKALTMPRPEIREWLPIWQAYRSGVYHLSSLLIFVALILFALFVMRRKEKWELTEILVWVVTLGLSLWSVRHIPFFVLALCALLPPALKYYEDYLSLRLKTHALFSSVRRVFAGVLLVLSAVILVIFFTRAPFSLIAGPYYPVGATRYLIYNHLSGNLLVYYDWGEYIIFDLYPHFRVAMDGRYETVYPPKVCQIYWDFCFARPNWKAFLEQYPPDFILWPPNKPITRLLTRDPAWRIVYSDKFCILFKSISRQE
ncbi:MAG: hypothetical protein P8X58_02905 [Syntrophobacterales bacterium]